MSYTFGFTHQVDYPSLGICGVCGVRYTHGCEHSNTLEAQEWLAAYIVAEQMQSYNPDVQAIETHIESADILDWVGETPNKQDENLKAYFGKVKFNVSDEWRKRHL